MKACCKNDWSAVWEFISKRVYFLLTRHSVQSVCVLQMCYKCVTQAEQKPEKQSCLRITFEINRAEIKKCGKTSPSTSNTAEKDNCQIIIWWRINKSPNDWVSLWICCRLSLKTQSWRTHPRVCVCGVKRDDKKTCWSLVEKHAASVQTKTMKTRKQVNPQRSLLDPQMRKLRRGRSQALV